MRMKISGLMMGAVVGGLLAVPFSVRAADDANINTPGPLDSLQDLQDTGKMLFKMADTNNDNRISQKEAVDVGNLMVGGFFFRADADGDGTVTKEEAQQARDALLRQKPLLRIVLERAPKSGSGEGNEQAQDAMKGFMALVDSNNDGQLQATELRQLVQTSVQGLYAQADTDRDGHLTPSELNAAVTGMAQAAADASFQAADANNDGSLDKEEFDKMIIEPARVVFRIIDADGDGKISKEEAQSAQRTVNRQLQMLSVPEPDNSLTNQIQDAQQRGGAGANASPRTPGGNRENAPGQRRENRQNRENRENRQNQPQ